nr:unnamed protein product [Spirometra erinaceieuropaei]
MFRITCKILLNEANQLGEMRKNLVSRRKTVERQRKKLFKDIDGASNDLLSACRIAFLRAERRLDQLQAHSKAELSTVLDNQKLMELAIKLLQVAKNPAQKEIGENLLSLNLLTPYGSAAAATATAANFHLPRSSAYQNSTVLEPATNPKASSSEAQPNTTECADQPGSAVEIYVDVVKGKVTAENLRTYFAQFGEVVDVSLFMNSSTNRHYGGGYLALRPTCDVATILRTEHTVCGSRINARMPVVGGKRQKRAARTTPSSQPSCLTPSTVPESCLPSGPAAAAAASMANSTVVNGYVPSPPPPPPTKDQLKDCEQMVICQPEPLQHQQQQLMQRQQNQQEEEEPRQSGQHQQSQQHRNDLHNCQTVDKWPRDLELYVDGLSAGITAETLKTQFDSFGEVLDVDMSTDSSTDEDSKNGAYITLRTTADPSQILETEHILCGVSINVEECESCDDSENDSVCEAQSNTTECADQTGSAVEIYVDGVKGKITAENLRTYFAQFGEVLDVSLFMHPSTNRHNGCGYIRLRTTCDVATILRTQHTVCGSRINAREHVRGKRQKRAARMDGDGNQQFANKKPLPPPPKYQLEDCEQMVLCQPETLQNHHQQQQQNQQDEEEQEQQPLQSRQHQQSEQHGKDLNNYQTVDKSPRDLELYVDGLSAAITAETLKTHFDRFGEVLDIDMSTDSSTNEDSRDAYITLRTTADSSQILETEHIICGVSINVEECESCDDSENDSVCEAQSNTTDCADQPGSAVQIYVDGVKAKLTAENLRTYFAQFGEVLDVSLFMHSSTNRHCGGGYITLRPTCDVATILRTEHIVRGSHINAREAVVGSKRPNPAATPLRFRVKQDFELVPLLAEDNVKTMRQNVSSPTTAAQAQQLPQQKAGIVSVARSIAADGAKQALSAVELYVDGVKADTTAETLRTYFSQFGEVLDVSLFMHPSENTACGNGLITLRPTFDVATIVHTTHSIHGDRINAKEPADGGKQHKDAGRVKQDFELVPLLAEDNVKTMRQNVSSPTTPAQAQQLSQQKQRQEQLRQKPSELDKQQKKTKHSIHGDRINGSEPADGGKQQKDPGRPVVRQLTGQAVNDDDEDVRTPILVGCETQESTEVGAPGKENAVLQFTVKEPEQSCFEECPLSVARRIAIRPTLYTIEEVSEEEVRAEELNWDDSYEKEDDGENGLEEPTLFPHQSTEDNGTAQKPPLVDTNVPLERTSLQVEHSCAANMP